MKKLNIIVASVIVVIALFLFLPSLLMSEGSMPSEQEGILLRNDVLSYSEGKDGFIWDLSDAPEPISTLSPLHLSIDESGVLVVFRSVFVEDYGYYYSKDDVDLSEDEMIFMRMITDGVYKYYNPG